MILRGDVMKTTMSRMKRVTLGIASLLGLGLAMIIPASCGDDCGGKTYYGPPPCQSDQECIDANGANWYCDKEHVVDKACDIKWATCIERQ